MKIWTWKASFFRLFLLFTQNVGKNQLLGNFFSQQIGEGNYFLGKYTAPKNSAPTTNISFAENKYFTLEKSEYLIGRKLKNVVKYSNKCIFFGLSLVRRWSYIRAFVLLNNWELSNFWFLFAKFCVKLQKLYTKINLKLFAFKHTILT